MQLSNRANVQNVQNVSNIMLTCSLAFFNVMLKSFGVSGVKVQEVVSLDAEILSFLSCVSASTVVEVILLFLIS